MTILTAVVSDKTIEFDADAWVPWWSFGKTVLATAALALVAKGRLQMDQPLGARPFTLRHVLQHRAGIPEYGRLRDYHAAVAKGDVPWPAAEMRRRVRAETLLFPPGQGWSYSNVGYLLVRELVEEQSGASLDAALRSLVLDPLGIGDARVAAEPADLDATAWGNAAGYHPAWVYHGLLIGPPAAAATLLHRLMAGHLLPPALLDAMRDRHQLQGYEPDPDRPWRSAGYGLGLMIGDGHVGHSGGGPGSSAAVYQRYDDPGCTAAAFAAIEAPGVVEHCARRLADQCR